MGWQGPALIFAFFLGSATVTRLVASPVAALTARVQAADSTYYGSTYYGSTYYGYTY